MLTTAERMRIFQIVSIHAYERAGPAKKGRLDDNAGFGSRGV